MIAKSTMTFASALVLFASLAVAAEDKGLPTFDLQKRCRASAQSTGAMLGDKTVEEQTYKSCMASETEAKNALVAAWKDIPQRYRAQCIKPNVYSPSYVEWIACLELELDVKNFRKKP